MERKSLEALMEDYRVAASATQETREPRFQRRWFRRLHTTYKSLREDVEGRAILRLLMNDPDSHVRLWAASHCLAWWPEEARAELERLRDGGGPGSFEADWTLREFIRGTLTFDFK